MRTMTEIEVHPEHGIIFWDVPKKEVLEQYRIDIEEMRRQMMVAEAEAETPPPDLIADF